MQTLFYDAKLIVRMFQTRYGLKTSEQFFSCADIQLTNFFVLATGLKPGKRVSISLPPVELQYEKGEISNIHIQIYINHNWNPVTMLWKAKSDRIYTIADTDIDCNDLEFWFEGLDPLLYYKQLYPHEELPFKFKNLSYELVVTRLIMDDCSINMYLRKEEIANATAIMNQTDDFIAAFNEQSEKLDRKYGVVHNWKRKLEADKLAYEIDTGSAGTFLLKRLLPFLSKMNCFSRIEIL